jgi:uncharacterized protein (TIGR02246 family)
VPANVKKRSIMKRTRVAIPVRRSKAQATAAIRDVSAEWARHWNAGDADGVAALYAEDAIYLPPHHEAVHGRDAIREYLRTPLSYGISDLFFEVTYIKQQGAIAWDVGTYRMKIPQRDGTAKEDHGKYLSVWRLTGKNWLLDADAWSSDLPVSVSI